MTEDLEIRVRLDVDDSEVDPALAKVGAKAGKKLPSPKMDVDTAPAQQKLGQVDAKAKTLHSTLAKPVSIDVNISKADQGIADIRAHFLREKQELEAMAIKIGMKPTGAGIAAGAGDLAEGLNAGRGGVGSALGAWGGMSTLGKLGVAGGVAGAVATPIVLGLKSSAGAAIQEQKLTGATTRAYGGTAFVDSAKQLADQTGFLAADFMEAALTGKSLINNYGMQKDQVAKLIQVSADLAAESPYKDLQTVAGSMDAVSSAARGSSQAAERLGVTTNDNYMKTMAFGGALRETWSAMTEAEQSQYRYKEILRQTQSVLGAAADESDVSSQVRKLNGSLGELKVAVGDELLDPLAQFVVLVRALVDSIPSWVPKAIGKAITAESFVMSHPQYALSGTVLAPAAAAGAAKNRGQQVIDWANTGVWNRAAKEKAGMLAHPEATKVFIEMHDKTGAGVTLDAGSSAPSPY